MSQPAQAARRSSHTGLILLGVAVALAVSVVPLALARRGGRTAAAPSGRGGADEAWLASTRAAFTSTRAATREHLKAQCRVLAEDPRLKASLGTEGIDERTVADILEELRRLAGVQFMAVLTPDGRVLAAIGTEGLAGLDMRNSPLVRDAAGKPDANVVAMGIGDAVMEVGSIAVRFDATITGFLVVGVPLGGDLFTRLHEMTGSAVALVIDGKVKASAPSDQAYREAFEALAARSPPIDAAAFDAGGKHLVGSLSEIGDGLTFGRTRLALVRPASVLPRASSANLDRILWLPPVAVLLLAGVVLLLARRSARSA